MKEFCERWNNLCAELLILFLCTVYLHCAGTVHAFVSVQYYAINHSHALIWYIVKL